MSKNDDDDDDASVQKSQNGAVITDKTSIPAPVPAKVSCNVSYLYMKWLVYWQGGKRIMSLQIPELKVYVTGQICICI